MKLISKFLLLISFFAVAGANFAFADTYPEFCEVFTRTLKPGDVGQDVKRLQVVLGQEGIAYLPSTGYFGPGTERAVKVFQQRNGIYPVGKVGPQTYRFMKNLWCFGQGGNSTNLDNVYIPIDTRNPELPTTGWNTGGNNWNNTSVPELSLQPVSSLNNSVTISWNTRAVNRCSLSGNGVILDGLNPSGQQVFVLSGEASFALKCFGYNGREYSKQIVVRPNQPISNLPWVNVSITPNQVYIGQQATLYWTSQNTSYCTSNVLGYNSNLQTSGSIPVTVVSGLNSFTFTCYNQSGQSVSQTITATTNNQTNLYPTINNLTYSNNYLAWGTTNANSCTLTGGNLGTANVQTNGNYYVPTPNVNTTWTLTCYGANNQVASRQVNYNIYTTGNPTNNINSNFTVTVTTDKSSYNIGEATTFNINVRNNTNSNLTYNEPICDPFYSFMINGTSVFATPQAQCLAYGSNVATLASGQTKTYTLTVPAGYSNITNSSGTKTINFRFYPTSSMGTIDINQTLTVNVSGTNNSTLSASLSANPTSVAYSGQLVVLSWSSANATYCNLYGGNINLTNQSTSGSYTVYPNTNTNYSVTCYNANSQNTTANVQVNVTNTTTGSPTVNISASPNPVAQNQLTNLTWYSTNASYCNIVGGNTNLASQPANGSYAVAPAQSTNYTITCYNNNGQNASAYVYVTLSGGTNTNTNTSLFITSNSNRNVNVNVYKAPYNSCNSGYINWGDGTSNTNYTYPSVTSGSACQIGVTHYYSNVGTYTISAYENNQMVASTQVTVQ